jgi:hypothetical protein
MSGTPEHQGDPLGMRRGDFSAVLWAAACCWLGVWGNYVLLSIDLEAPYIVPFDLFGVPIIVTAAFWLIGKALGRGR